MDQDTTNRSSKPSKRTTLVGILIGLTMVTAAWGPMAQASFHGPYQDLGETVEAGEYLAYQVELPTGGWVLVGGEYNDVTSQSAVLPIASFVDGVDNGYAASTGFYYDAFLDEDAGVDVTVTQEEAGSHNVHTHDKEISSSPFPGIYFGMSSGTYNIVQLTGPADGEADLWLDVPDDATVIEEEQGEATWARGLDESAVGYEIRTQAMRDLVGVDHYEWYYSGADVEIDVDGALYGYMGFSSDTQAHWLNPDGEEADRWAIGEDAGTWTMSFPEERFQYRSCLTGTVCVGDDEVPWRVYPPFGVAVDLDFD